MNRVVIELLVWLLNCSVVIGLTKRKIGFRKIANTNTFFIPMKKLSQSYAHMDSHDATFEYSKCYYRGGLKFYGHTFIGGGRIFGLLT